MKNAVLSLRSVLSLKSQFSWLLGSTLHRWLAASVMFSMLMITARVVYTGELTFTMLVWNLFLAYVPFFITGWLQNRPSWIEVRWKFAAAFLCWLLFVPNSFYIITDLFHLSRYYGMPIWFDLALILSFAWNGLLLGILSVRDMERMTRLHLGYKNESWFIYPIMFINAFGVYIGRYLRFNTWDVIASPFGLALDIMDIIVHPIEYKHAWGMVICYGTLMSFIYITLKKISHQINK
jgi:uncharacterized membrane protein